MGEGDQKWVSMLVVPFRGQNQRSSTFYGVSNFSGLQRPSRYLLGCFSLSKIPEMSITRTGTYEHIDRGVVSFGIFQFFCF